MFFGGANHINPQTDGIAYGYGSNFPDCKLNTGWGINIQVGVQYIYIHISYIYIYTYIYIYHLAKSIATKKACDWENLCSPLAPA